MKKLLVFIILISGYASADEKLLKLARVLSYQKKYQESLAYYDKYLVTRPRSKEALTEKAEILSWIGRYDESLNCFDQSLDVQFSPRVAVKKARVLGWMGEYDKANDSYRQALERKNDKSIKLEMEAKHLYWNRYHLQAMDKYRELLQIDPANFEALNDLAQIEAIDNLYSEALADFDKIFKVDDTSVAAGDGIRKIELEREYLKYRATFTSWRARSPDKVTDIDNKRLNVYLQTPLHQRWNLITEYVRDNYYYKGYPDPLRDQLQIGPSYTIAPRLQSTLLLRQTVNYSYDRPLLLYYNFKIDYKLSDPWRLAFYSDANDLINNYQVMAGRYHYKDYYLKLTWVMNRIWEQELNYKLSTINDGNQGGTTWLKESLFFYFGYFQFLTTVDFQYQSWKHDYGRIYFSPKDFWSVPATFHFRYYYNDNGRHFGARDFFWGVKYRVQYDKNADLLNGLGGEINYDFDDTYSIFAEVEMANSDNYDDFKMLITFKGYI